MKKPSFIVIFFAVQLFLVFFYISHQAQVIKLSYQKQKLEKQLDNLTTEKNKLNTELMLSQNKNGIRQYAQRNLGFQKINLKQIKSLKDEC